MKPLFYQPISLGALARFHREVVLPDLARIVERFTTPRFDVVHADHEFIKLGLARIEICLAQMDRQLDRCEKRDRELGAALHRLEERLGRLQASDEPQRRVDAVRARMHAAEKHLAARI